MLIDNKFIYLSLPRCASTAFHYSCLVNDINVQTNNSDWEESNAIIDFKSVDKKNLMDFIYHGHESINNLQNKFGIDYPVIAVKRERHERFYSLYKHTLSDLKRTGYHRIYEKFSKLSLDELFFFTKEDLLTKKQRWDVICDYLIDLKLLDDRIDISITSKSLKSEEEHLKLTTKGGYVINMIDILLTPISFWTNNNPNIKWFDFNEMDKMENWVSNILEKPFQLHSVNSSKHMECDVKLDDKFIEKYDSIYDYYDLPKKIKTLI
jgi:hypothetical protein